MSDNRVGAGDITIKFGDGDKITLRPTWGAAQAISKTYGGITGAIDRVVRLDLDAIQDIIAIGMGFTGTRKPPGDLANKVWSTGFTDRTGGIQASVVKYLHVLAAGGRPVDEAADNDGDGERPLTEPNSSASSKSG